MQVYYYLLSSYYTLICKQLSTAIEYFSGVVRLSTVWSHFLGNLTLSAEGQQMIAKTPGSSTGVTYFGTLLLML